ncbi:MAG: UrcA family protein [Pseudomonadota bacterium]
MERLVGLLAAGALFGLPASAQSYRCVGGELLGGPDGYRCETNTNGQITRVTPPPQTGPRGMPMATQPLPQTPGTTVRSTPITRTVPATRTVPVTRTVPAQTHHHVYTRRVTPAPVVRRYALPTSHHLAVQPQPQTGYTVTRRYVTQQSAAPKPSIASPTHHHQRAPFGAGYDSYTPHRTVTRTRRAPPRQPAPIHYAETRLQKPSTVRAVERPLEHRLPNYIPSGRVQKRISPTATAVWRGVCADKISRLSDTKDGRKRYEVCYSDLKPITSATADDLYGRIRLAARRACGRSGALSGANRSCQRSAIRDAVVEVNRPALDAIYASKTGKRVPRVKVGPLRRGDS